jgi:hypothetical protein
VGVRLHAAARLDTVPTPRQRWADSVARCTEMLPIGSPARRNRRFRPFPRAVGRPSAGMSASLAPLEQPTREQR